MTTRRSRVVQRLGIIAAATVVVGSYFTGMAFAADGGSTPPPSNSSSSGSSSTGSSGSSLVKTLEDAGVPDLTSNSGTNSGSGASAAAATSCSGIDLGVLGCIPTSGLTLPSLPTGSSTSATGPSGSNTVVVYSPYPYPVFGDYGHRYYGRYHDSGCGCDRYAAPTYVAPATVTATQVSSVPKGGVDTGDGSFQ